MLFWFARTSSDVFYGNILTQNWMSSETVKEEKCLGQDRDIR